MARPISIDVLGDASSFETAMDRAVDAARDTDTAMDRAADSARSFDDRMEGVGDGADTLASKGAQLAGALAGLGDTIGGPFGDALSLAGGAFQTAADAGDLLNVAVEGGGKLWSQATGALSSLTKAETYSNLAKQAGAAAQWALNAAMSANPIMIVVLAIAALVAGLIWFFTQTDVGREAWGKFTKFLTDIWGKFSSFIGALWPSIVGFFTSAGDKISSAWTKVVNWFQSVPGKIGGFFKDLPGNLVRIGSDLIAGLWNGINDKIGWIKDKIAGFVDSVVGWFKNFFDTHSPSRRTYAIGHDVGDGLIGGVADSIDAGLGVAEAAMDRLATTVTDSFAPSLDLDGAASWATSARSRRRASDRAQVIFNVNGAVDTRGTGKTIRNILTGDARARGILDLSSVALP
jgi:hypothetical protein